MMKNKNVKKTIETGALPKRHSEGIRPKNPLHILKRFFAKYNFPFAGSCVKPAQNDGKLLVPQCFSNLLSSCPLSLPSPSVLLRSHNTGTAIAFHPLLACAWGEGFNNITDLSSYRLIDFPTFKKLAAFTLAEVLITLGIIGVVAAMTIPTLISKYQDKVTIAQLKETYSIFTQAVKMAENEYGEAEGWGITQRDEAGANIVAEKLKPFLKITLDCGTTEYGRKKCLSGSTYKVCNLNNISCGTGTAAYYLALNNGAVVSLHAGENGSTGIIFYVQVDTNGMAKPNRWGYDYYEFTYFEGKGLMPSGNPQISGNSYKTTCMNTKQTGFGCAYYVLTYGTRDYLKK